VVNFHSNTIKILLLYSNNSNVVCWVYQHHMKYQMDLATCRGIFVPERHSGRFWEGGKPEWHSGTFFPGIGITNTTPLQPNAGSLFAFQNLFLKKNSAGYMIVFVAYILDVPDSYTSWQQLSELRLLVDLLPHQWFITCDHPYRSDNTT
jgi:hypothetical protein